MWLLSAAMLWGCGESQKTPPAPAAPSPAEIQQAEVERRIAAQKAEREAKAKAKADAEAQKQAKIDAIAVAPDPLPKRMKLPKACAKLAKTYDDFMHRLYDGKAIEQWDGGGKKMQLAMTKKNCLQQNVGVALCQVNALSKATADIKKEVPAIFRTCLKKYGKAAAK